MITKEAQVTSPEQSRRLFKKAVFGKTMFEWVERVDQYGKLNLLEDNLKSGIPAYTVAELMDLLPQMSTFTFLLFCFRTRLKPDAVADYVISKL